MQQRQQCRSLRRREACGFFDFEFGGRLFGLNHQRLAFGCGVQTDRTPVVRVRLALDQAT